MDDLLGLSSSPPHETFSWFLTPQQKAQYAEEFKPYEGSGFLSGQAARTLFPQLGVQLVDLQHIWTLSDRDFDNQLSFPEFCISRFLIDARKQGQELPTVLPSSLLSSLPSAEQQVSRLTPMGSNDVTNEINKLSISPRKSKAKPKKPFIITPEHRSKYQDIFDKHNEDGFVSGSTAIDLFGRSNLPQKDLATIWTLSDIDQDSKLNKREFFIAMHLITLRVHKFDIPETVPQDLLESSITESAPSNLSPASPRFSGSSGHSAVPSYSDISRVKTPVDPPPPKSSWEPYDPQSDLYRLESLSTVSQVEAFLEDLTLEVSQLTQKLQKQKALDESLVEKHELHEKQIRSYKSHLDDLQRQHMHLDQVYQTEQRQLDVLSQQLKNLLKNMENQQIAHNPSEELQILYQQRKELGLAFRSVIQDYQNGKKEHAKLLAEFQKLKEEEGIASNELEAFRWQDHGFKENQEMGDKLFDETSSFEFGNVGSSFESSTSSGSGHPIGGSFDGNFGNSQNPNFGSGEPGGGSIFGTPSLSVDASASTSTSDWSDVFGPPRPALSVPEKNGSGSKGLNPRKSESTKHRKSDKKYKITGAKIRIGKKKEPVKKPEEKKEQKEKKEKKEKKGRKKGK